ncbi:COG4280 domain-containing protein [Nonomuraea lactucae]|uniref:COG4280 domain-containing protein n=1 Tax=Nonomuraea lactucae TaxID=2249762 RepID=UPI000DE3D2FE|nr:TMEM165/GDT1 family protein [Nonomuraea lactucae]
MTGTTWGLVASISVASIVEFVEALTIVLAMGVTRGWRSALAGVAAAIVALAVFTFAAGYALKTWMPESLMQLVVGTLLLIFGLQWLRKAVLRSSKLKALHDEQEEFAAQTAAARQAAANSRFGIDTFAFVVSFKGVFLEGVEIVFIVITFGLSADNMPAAIGGAVVSGLLVLVVGLILHKPLAMVPENTLKYGVGLLLASFGAYWSVEGLGVFIADGESLHWPGDDWAILGLLAAWAVVSQVLVRTLPGIKNKRRETVTG